MASYKISAAGSGDNVDDWDFGDTGYKGVVTRIDTVTQDQADMLLHLLDSDTLYKTVDDGNDSMDALIDGVNNAYTELLYREDYDSIFEGTTQCNIPPGFLIHVPAGTGESQFSQMTEESPNSQMSAKLSPSPKLTESPVVNMSPLVSRGPRGIGMSNQQPYYPSPLQPGSPDRSARTGKGTIATTIATGQNIDMQSLTLTILSGVLRKTHKNIFDAMNKGKSKVVYDAIANILFQQEVSIKIRDKLAGGNGNEKQMELIYGETFTQSIKSGDRSTKCYLCGGKLVSKKDGGQPEMEHKYACARFYGIFQFLLPKYAEEHLLWQELRDSPPRGGGAYRNFQNDLIRYYYAMNSDDGIDLDGLDKLFENLYKKFEEFVARFAPEYTKPLPAEFKILVRAYLNECAYAHHLCNQLKNNYDLGDPEIREKYYDTLKTALNLTDILFDDSQLPTCFTKSQLTQMMEGRPSVTPCVINIGFANAERDSIIKGLGLNGKEDNTDNAKKQRGDSSSDERVVAISKKGSTDFENRQVMTSYHMRSLDICVDAYSGNLGLSNKRLILNTIQEMFRHAIIKKPVARGNTGKKETKSNRIARLAQEKTIVNTFADSGERMKTIDDLLRDMGANSTGKILRVNNEGVLGVPFAALPRGNRNSRAIITLASMLSIYIERVQTEIIKSLIEYEALRKISDIIQSLQLQQDRDKLHIIRDRSVNYVTKLRALDTRIQDMEDVVLTAGKVSGDYTNWKRTDTYTDLENVIKETISIIRSAQLTSRPLSLAAASSSSSMVMAPRVKARPTATATTGKLRFGESSSSHLGAVPPEITQWQIPQGDPPPHPAVTRMTEQLSKQLGEGVAAIPQGTPPPHPAVTRRSTGQTNSLANLTRKSGGFGGSKKSRRARKRTQRKPVRRTHKRKRTRKRMRSNAVHKNNKRTRRRR
jgi:hypothetical protein